MLERLTLGAAWMGEEVGHLPPIMQNPWSNRLIPPLRRRKAELAKFGQFARSCVTARMDRRNGNRKDMLTCTLESHLKRPEVYTKADIVSDAHTIVFAGSDTTAIVISINRAKLTAGAEINFLSHLEESFCLPEIAKGNR